MPLASMIASVVADFEVGSVVGFPPMSAADRPVTSLGVLAIRGQFRG
jgi:hypothetical protein